MSPSWGFIAGDVFMSGFQVVFVVHIWGWGPPVSGFCWACMDLPPAAVCLAGLCDRPLEPMYGLRIEPWNGMYTCTCAFSHWVQSYCGGQCHREPAAIPGTSLTKKTHCWFPVSGCVMLP
jgi:hypothetical protein